MLINDMPAEAKVTIEVNIGLNTLEFETGVVKGFANPLRGIFVNPIMKDDKMINFNIKGIICRVIIIHPEENAPYRWLNVRIKAVQERDGSRFHAILSPEQGKKMNRRQSYRVWLGVDAVARIGTDQATYDVIVRDVSSTGVGFICKKEIEVHEGNLVHLSFFDETTGTNFSVTGVVKRCAEVDELHVLYGCRWNTMSPLIDRFVVKKQQEMVKKKNESPRRAEIADKLHGKKEDL